MNDFQWALRVAKMAAIGLGTHIKYAFKSSQRLVSPVTRNFDYSCLTTVSRWQTRQAQEGLESVNEKDFGYLKMLKAWLWVRRNISYQLDRYDGTPTDYWQTVAETMGRGMGDCEDQAILTMARLREAGIPQDMLGCLWVSNQDGSGGHVLAIVQHEADDFYLLDNGHFLDWPMTAKAFLAKRPDIKIKCAFSFDDVWGYGE